ncbi:MAG: hypothetical protein L3J74_01410 [Bacteroidales bacterium]|nr:hypothetical protein [Bacteroidales bacterium]
MKKRSIILWSILFLVNTYLFSQEELKNWELSGYITNMQTVQFQNIDSNWINDNLIHNRINFTWYPNDKWTFKIAMRNRIFTGESVKLIPGYADLLKDADQGFLNLNRNIIKAQSAVLNTTIDRLLLQYETGKFIATIGRQRINWGKTFVWNPNDLFNAYSFFDFDYPEKPGSDALRLQYYTGIASSVELAANIKTIKNQLGNTEENKYTIAALWRFNKWEYDFQILAGYFENKDITLGGAWSGSVKNWDFKGEFSYLYPDENMKDTSGQFIASIYLGYMFPNSLNLQFEFLYIDIPADGITNFYQYYYQPLSVKTLSFTEYNLFSQISYPISPLLNASFASMYYPKIKGYYIGPSVDYSFTDNLYMSMVVQSFSGETPNPVTGIKERNNATFMFLRLKWNF